MGKSAKMTLNNKMAASRKTSNIWLLNCQIASFLNMIFEQMLSTLFHRLRKLWIMCWFCQLLAVTDYIVRVAVFLLCVVYVVRGLMRIHPSFRIIALTEPPVVGSSSQQWLNAELLTMFLYHNMRSLSVDEELCILNKLVSEHIVVVILSFVNCWWLCSCYSLFFKITSRSGATRRNGSTCVDLVEDCKKATSVNLYVAIKFSQNKENRIATITCTHHMYSSCSVALITITICIKLSIRRPARSPSFARTASSAETV